MALNNIHLRKLLKVLYLEPNRRTSALRADIREDIARESGEVGGGGDFYAPFWFDAKNHVFERRDLSDAVAERIAANSGRGRLYPLLRDGFLVWWDERRRWSNRPFRQSDWIKSTFVIPELNSTIKIDNVMSVRDSQDANHFIYPYFAPDPLLREEAARIGLWVIGQALPELAIDEVRILDVIRGQTYSVDRNRLQGNEEEILLQRFQSALIERDLLRREYD
jgi:hypothetical protein